MQILNSVFLDSCNMAASRMCVGGGTIWSVARYSGKVV